MNILVIGNGFDLAHGLPTTYQDFLKFTDSYMSYSEYISGELLSEIKNLISGNRWINHFQKFYKYNGWIGFEREISDIIKLLDKKSRTLKKSKRRNLVVYILI